jgi:hypothetical protein
MNESPSLDSGKAIPQRQERLEHLEISIDAVLGMQQLLMRLMVPKAIKPYVTESGGEDIGIEDDLFMRWNEKYSGLFREYCDSLDATIDSERKRIERITEGRLTSDDYAVIQQYLEDPVHERKEEGIGGPFFSNEDEEAIFLKKYVH